MRPSIPEAEFNPLLSGQWALMALVYVFLKTLVYKDIGQ